MQLFDATLLALGSHGMNAEQLGKLLPFDLSVGIQKGLRLRERVGHHVAQAVTGADSDRKIDEIKGTRETRISGDNVHAYRNRVKRIRTDSS